MLLQHDTPEAAFWLVVALAKKYEFGRYFSWNGRKGQMVDSIAFRDLLASSDSKLLKRLVRTSLSLVKMGKVLIHMDTDGKEYRHGRFPR